MNIVICDDEASCRQALCDAIIRWSSLRNMNIAPVSQAFASSEELLYAWENGLEMDMLFLDIQIPGEMSGLEVAKAIRKVDSQICIAFTTSYSEYACEGYSVSALRYLRKPIDDEQLFECLDIAYHQWFYRQDSSIFLDAQRRKVVLPLKQIVYAEIRGHYVAFHRTIGEPLQIRSNMAALAEKLPPQMFVQCHRSFLVNLLYVRNITKSEVILAGGGSIPVGASYADAMFQVIQTFYQGGGQSCSGPGLKLSSMPFKPL